MRECWDAFDRLRCPLNKTMQKGAVFSKQEYHVIIHSWVRRKSDGKLLISKRAPDIFWGGYWQVTGGSVLANETSLDGACRELQEELRFCVKKSCATLLFSYAHSPLAKDNPSFFLDCYLFEVDDDVASQKITLLPEETVDYRWVNLAELVDLHKNGLFMPFEETWPPYFDVLFANLQKPASVQACKIWGAKQLALAETLKRSKTIALDVSLLLAFVLNTQKDDLLLKNDEKLSSEQIILFLKLLLQRCEGTSVAHLTGTKAFWRYNFAVNSAVLVPKPDTELLVEKALEELKKIDEGKSTPNVADICTGSGCVAICILGEFAQKQFAPRVVATDISPLALKVARQNAKSILAPSLHQNIDFRLGDLCAPLKNKKFDLIVTNPPYVPSNLTEELLKDGRLDPRLALDGGLDGTTVIQKLCKTLMHNLKNGGVVLIESGEYNASATRDFLRQNGFVNIQTFCDLGGMPRVTRAQKP